jgi:hypothetical protein
LASEQVIGIKSESVIVFTGISTFSPTGIGPMAVLPPAQGPGQW